MFSLFDYIHLLNIRICEDCIKLRIALLKAEDRVEKLKRQYTEINRKYIKLSEELEGAKRNKQPHNWTYMFNVCKQSRV